MSKSFLKLFVSVIKYLYRIQFTYSFVVRFAPNRYMWDDSNMHTHRKSGLGQVLTFAASSEHRGPRSGHTW